MNYKQFSKREMGDILDVIQLSLACQTRGDVMVLMARVKELVSADQAICGLGVIDPREGPKIFDLINVNYPEEWLAHYAQEGLYKSDPIILHQLKVMKPQYWDDSYKLFVDKPYVDFMHKASDFGLHHGIATGCSASNTDKICIFSFAGEQDRFEAHHKAVLDVVTPHLFQGLIKMYQYSK
ncbi:MAG: autoinducer binding domain-containing protein [Thermodesulfobacteriota bacterium]